MLGRRRLWLPTRLHRVWGHPPQGIGRWHSPPCHIRISFAHWDRTTLCPDREGGAGINLGMREVCPIPRRSGPLHHWNWSQSPCPTVWRIESAEWPTAMHPMLTHAPHEIRLLHHPCTREEAGDCRCTLPSYLLVPSDARSDPARGVQYMLGPRSITDAHLTWKLEQIRVHQQEDEVCQALIRYCKRQWPVKHELPGPLKHYWQ